MCYILCMTRLSVYVVSSMWGGHRGVEIPCLGGLGAVPSIFLFYFCVHF
jgi:hypothetical protein